MENDSFKNLCIFNVHDALRDGLSHFSQQSRAALLYALERDDPIRIYDPQNLLRGHEPKLKELFLEHQEWRLEPGDNVSLKFMEPIEVGDYSLTGLICYGSRSRSCYFQIWYTEHHPDMCSIGPTIRWLEYAASLLSQNFSTENILSIGTSGYVLQECASHAIRDYIVDQRNVLIGWDTRLRIFPVLDAVLGISKTLEEGAKPMGELAFVDPDLLSLVIMEARLPLTERPLLKNFKHVRKLLLAVENSSRRLISDGASIIGITAHNLPQATVRASFCGSSGFLRLDDELVCSFYDGHFYSSTRKANLVHVEEALLESNLNPNLQHDLFKIITELVHSAGEREHGCTLVIDFNDAPIDIPGHKLEVPVNLTKPHCLDLAKSLAKVDGALHIGSDLGLHGFACLLDGLAVRGEYRDRGARFNSALRFTAIHPELIVVVVSSDQPVSVIQGGIELTAQCEWKPVSGYLETPPLLTRWLEA